MERVDMHRLQELVRLHRMGVGARETARLLRMGPSTERDYRRILRRAGLFDGAPSELPTIETLKQAVQRELGEPKRPQHASSIEEWRDAVSKMHIDDGAAPTAIYDKLRLDSDFKGSLSAVKRLCARLAKERGIQAEDVVLRVETEPGEVAQVDFGYVGTLWDAEEKRLRKAWVFVMVLAYSRHQFVRIVFDQKVETWLRLHVEAFTEWGGVPAVVVPDNLKAAVVRAAFAIDEPCVLNRSYRELARHFGFKIDPTPPRSPEKKGKVESSVKYVKHNFFKSRQGEQDTGVLSLELERWVHEIAGQRRHGTTGERPLEAFRAIEQAALEPLPEAKWKPAIWAKAKVHPDTHVLVARGLYSVPWRFVGQSVLARCIGQTVELYVEDVRVATHERVGPGKRSTHEEHLPEKRRAFRHRNQEYWIERAAQMGPEVERYIRMVFDSDDVLLQLRVVQHVVTHLEKYPVERARATCARASFYGTCTYGGIKNILNKALDREPLPVVVLPARGGLEKPRFARDIRELVELPLEDTDASQ